MNKKKSRKGIALAFALVLLSLMLVIGVSFIILSANERASSAAAANAVMARQLAQTGINRAKLSMLPEIANRGNLDGSAGGGNEFRSLNDFFYSQTSKEEGDLLASKTAAGGISDNIDRLFFKGASDNTDPKLAVQWNYVTTPDIPGSSNYLNPKNKKDQKIIGRFAYLGFAGSKISLESILDSAWDSGSPPRRAGFSPREIRPEAALDADGANILQQLAPRTSTYLGVGNNQTEKWPDIDAVAKTLGYTENDVVQMLNLYNDFAVGKLPSPEMWRMSPYGAIPYKAYHRFNLFKTKMEWDNSNWDEGNFVEHMMKLSLDNYAWLDKSGRQRNWTIPEKDIGLYFITNATANGEELPGMTEIDMRKQLLANLKDYNDVDFTCTTNLGEQLNTSTMGEIQYAGLERVPYFTNVLLAFSYIVEPMGADAYDITFALDNFACEMHNIYENPDIEIENFRLVFDMDIEVETSSNAKFYIKGKAETRIPLSDPDADLGEKCYRGRNPDYKGSYTTSEGRRQPYFIVSATRGLPDGINYEDNKTVNGPRPKLKKITYKRVAAAIAGDVTWTHADGSRKMERDRVLNIARCTIPSANYVQNLDLSGEAGNEGQSRPTMAFSNDCIRTQVVPIKKGVDWTNGHDFYWEISGRTVGNWLAVCANGLCAFGKADGSGATGKYPDNAKKGIYDPEPDGTGPNGWYTRSHPCWASTAFIRNAPMISPWELGFIHRMRSYQTINLKKFNTESPDVMDMSLEGYQKGDAAILDQVKFTEQKISYGKININTASENVLRALTKDIVYGSKPAKFEQGSGPNISAPQLPRKEYPKMDNNIVPEGDPVVNEKERVIKRLNGMEFVSTKAGGSSSTGLINDYFKAKQVPGKNGDEPLAQWYSRARIVNVMESYLNSIYGISDYFKINDADYEEIIGKMVNLFEAETAREVHVIVVAQAIQQVKKSNNDMNQFNPKVDRIVGECKLLVTFEYWPKLTPNPTGDDKNDYQRSDWVVKKIIYLEPTAGGV